MIGLYETGINGILADEMVSNIKLVNYTHFNLGPGQNCLSNFVVGIPERVQICKELLSHHCTEGCDPTLEERVQEMVP